MTGRQFLIPSLLLAGFTPAAQVMASDGVAASQIGEADSATSAGAALFRGDGQVLLAQHRSHRSHRSHSSHSSHRSSASGSYYPLYTPPPPPPPPVTRSRQTILPSTLLTRPLPAPPVADGYKAVVMRVQRGLLAFGYYDGGIDGVVGPGTRDALSRFQGDFKLKVTGTITPEVLDALKVSL